MYRKVLFIIVALLISMGASAQIVSEKDARIKAMQFLNKNAKFLSTNQRQLETVESGAKNVFAFNVGKGEGFILVSGDERTTPILGYSSNGTFDLANAPANLKAWIKGYGDAITALKDAEIPASTEASTEEPYGATIEPLVTARWDQEEPYNIMCPKVDDKYSFTGCPATALAQIMHYWKWPNTAVPSIPGYTTAGQMGNKSYAVEELDYTFFDWDNMCDTYGSDYERTAEQDTAVARLMRYVGQSMKMDYSPNVSGSFETYFPQVLKEYFNYAETVRHLQRYEYSTKEWESLIYNELAEGRPVGYAGYSDGGGHSFVCDGYDKDGYFHINWGWGGMCDGFFLLSVLNPYSNIGSGASYTYLGYCIAQEAVIGIKPADHNTGLLPKLSFTEGLNIQSGKTLVGEAHNVIARTGVFASALGTINEDGSHTPLVEGAFLKDDKSVEEYANVKPNDFTYFYFSTDNVNLPAGEYKLYPMSKCVSVVGDDWHLLTPEDHYVLLTVTEEGATFRLFPVFDLTVESPVVEKTALVTQSVKFNVTNNSTSDYNGVLTIVLTYNDHTDKNKNQATQQILSGAYIDAGETKDVEFMFSPICGGDVTFNVFAYNNLETPITSGTMHIEEPAELSLNPIQLSDYSFSCYWEGNELYKEIKITTRGSFKNLTSEAVIANFNYIIPDDLEKTSEQVLDRVGFNPGQTIKMEFTNETLDLWSSDIDDDPDYEIPFQLTYAFSAVYPEKVLFDGHLRIGKTITPNGYIDITTGIRDVNTKGDKVIYDLQGRHITAPARKGLYIVNGKKVLVNK